MARNGSGARIRELQRAIASLNGVRGARVQLDAAGVGHVRVLVAPDRGVAETIRDVRAIGLRRCRVDIQPDRVEVITAGVVPERRQRGGRRKLASLATERTDGHFVARVELDLGEHRLAGASESLSVRRFECRSVAGAVLESVRDLMDHKVYLEDVEMLSVGDALLAVVTLDRGSKMLIGAAQVRTDEHDAIARATLHALNRSLR